MGAYAVAIATVHDHGFEVRKRIFHGSGADLVMVRRGEPDGNIVRLEVSGIADAGSVGARVKGKLDQLERGDLKGPGFAVVVRFKAAEIRASAHE